MLNIKSIGLMTMLDSGKRDHKILAVAINDPEYNGVNTASELPAHRLAMLRRFFQDYKLLEGKTVEVDEMMQAEASESVILDQNIMILHHSWPNSTGRSREKRDGPYLSIICKSIM